MRLYFERSALIAFLIFSFLGSQVLFADPPKIVGTEMVTITKPDGKLWTAPYDALDTTIMFGGDKLEIPEKINGKPIEGIYVMYGGTGAKTKTHGIVNSLEPIARSALKRGFYPIAFENPIYKDSQRSDEERRPTIEKYKVALNQELWMAATFQLVVDLAPKRSDGRPAVEINAITRSTSSAMILDIQHRYLAGDSRFKIIESVADVTLQGLLGHTDEEVGSWLPREIEKGANPGELDKIVQDIEAELFSGMEFAPLNIPEPLRRNPAIKNLPKNYIILGAFDPRITPHDFFALVERFSNYHPDLDITVFGTDNDHNAVQTVTYDRPDGTKFAHKGKNFRFKPILDYIADDSTPYRAGLRFYEGPGFHDAALYQHKEAHLATCEALMKRLELYQLPLPANLTF